MPYGGPAIDASSSGPHLTAQERNNLHAGSGGREKTTLSGRLAWEAIDIRVPRLVSCALVHRPDRRVLKYPWHFLRLCVSVPIRLIEWHSHSLGPGQIPGWNFREVVFTLSNAAAFRKYT